MKLRRGELAFLSAWAREERAANPYLLPAHQLQAAHGVKGVSLIRLIKAPCAFIVSAHLNDVRVGVHWPHLLEVQSPFPA
jgi:hypothetical protein